MNDETRMPRWFEGRSGVAASRQGAAFFDRGKLAALCRGAATET
jgi:hypothetical protein